MSYEISEEDYDALQKHLDELEASLGVLLDSVDYTSGACRPNEMVGAVLPVELIKKAKKELGRK